MGVCGMILSMLMEAVFAIVGVFVFLFLFWRRLREDYDSEQIFSTCFYIFILMAIGEMISVRFFPLWWFWIEFTASLVAIGLASFRLKLRFFEILEAGILAFLPWLDLLFLKSFLENLNLMNGLYTVLIYFIILLFFYFDSHYKKFTWYKSGRVGFSGLSVMGIFFLIRAGIALKFSHVLSFVGNIEPLISALTAFIFFFGVYNLSRKES